MVLSFLPHIYSIFSLKVRSPGGNVGKRSFTVTAWWKKKKNCNPEPFLLKNLLLSLCCVALEQLSRDFKELWRGMYLLGAHLNWQRIKFSHWGTWAKQSPVSLSNSLCGATYCSGDHRGFVSCIKQLNEQFHVFRNTLIHLLDMSEVKMDTTLTSVQSIRCYRQKMSSLA